MGLGLGLGLGSGSRVGVGVGVAVEWPRASCIEGGTGVRAVCALDAPKLCRSAVEGRVMPRWRGEMEAARAV